MVRRLLFLLLLLFASEAVAASQVHDVEIRIEPPQAVTALVIRSGEITRAIGVRNGRVAVPPDIPLPWSLGMARFESDAYTRQDLEQKRPWVIRELGILHGKLQRRSPKDERFRWLLQGGTSENVAEAEIAVDAAGAFDLRLPAGTYHGALQGTANATRIRSGIVIKPGRTTDLGVVVVEPTVSVSLRVLDAKSGKGVSGARVIWDPPGEMLNAALSRKLYARRWSGVSDARGIVEIPAVGPLPHSVRWRIETKGYAPAQSARLQLGEPKRFTMPDVRLRHEPSVMVRVQFPRRDEESLQKCTLVAGEIRDPHSLKFVPVTRVPLREGDSRFDFTTYGRKRVWIENASRKKLFYHDFEVSSETTLVDLALQRVEIHGRVTQRGNAVQGALVTLADPHDARAILAQVPSDEDGEYRFTTWQSGKIFLYTIGPSGGPGRSVGGARTEVDVIGKTEMRVDLKFPHSGFSITVVDAETGAPVSARIYKLARLADGGAIMGMEETDARGRLDLSGIKEGTAYLHVEAKGYRAADLEIPIRSDRPETTVRLERGKPASGRVVTVQGAPVSGARLFGGYSFELADQSYHETSTDHEGRFSFETPPSPGTTFYVVAAGYALGMTTLRPDDVTTVVLHPPSSSIVTLRQDNKPPEKVFLVMAAPPGGSFIPLEVLETLADVNGMSLYQLCGSSVDGAVVLPEFLGPGRYDLFLARRGGKPFIYERAGAISTPLRRDTVVSIAGR
jgi:hypothetical protein